MNEKQLNSNLQDLRDLPEDKRKEIASAGGKASGEARRLKGTFKEIAKTLLDCQAPETALSKLLEVFPELSGTEIDNRAAMILSQMLKAIKGDTAAFMAIRDTAGEKPDEKNIHKFEGVNIVVADEKTARLIDKI